MTQPAFVVFSLDGQVRAYADDGALVPAPPVVAMAWAQVAGVQVVHVRPEPAQADGCAAANAAHRLAVEKRRAR